MRVLNPQAQSFHLSQSKKLFHPRFARQVHSSRLQIVSELAGADSAEVITRLFRNAAGDDLLRAGA
jgi:hypothetical protein